MRNSKWLSWILFGISAAVLGTVVLAMFGGGSSEGRWRESIEGDRVGELPLEDMAGKVVQLRHPSILFFFDRQCRFCPAASQQLITYVSAHGTAGLPVYAITHEWRYPQEEARKFAPGVLVVRLTRTVPNLDFVTDIPLLVRTDAAGVIQHAYVGVPPDSVIARLRGPRRAGSTVR
jgi:hypothetical protein